MRILTSEKHSLHHCCCRQQSAPDQLESVRRSAWPAWGTRDIVLVSNFTPAMVPFRQTSWQGLAVDANAMLNWRGSSIVPLMAIRAPLSEMSTPLQYRLANPPRIT